MASEKNKLSTLPIDLLLGWFVPGTGHLMRGFKRQGMIVLTVVLGLYLVGAILSDFEAVSRDLHPYAFWAELGVAGGTLPLLALDLGSEHVLPPQQSITDYVDVPRWNDTGVLFCCIAGLLNFLALFDLIDRSVIPPEERLAAGDLAADGTNAKGDAT